MATFRGTNLRNKLTGGAFGDTLLGLGGNDTLLGNSGADTLKGGTGNDTMDGGTGADKLFGEAGNDFLKGGSGNDKLDGGTGNDRLDGGANNDALTGGLGNDTIIGGTGVDTAFFGGLASASTITQVGTSLVISGANGVDVVGADVEFVRFADGLFSAAAQTFKLTTSDDAFTGGLRNDLFTSVINTQLTFNTTYTGADVLDGGGGTGDVLQISITGVNGVGTSTPPISLSNIEIVRILNQEGGFGVSELDASIWNGVTNIVAEGGLPGATTQITSLGNLVTAEMRNNASSLIIEYGVGVVDGLADVQSLVLSANNGGTFEIAGGTAETLAIASQGGANRISLTGGHNFSTLNVTGNQHLDITIPGGVTTLNASGMTGGGVLAEGLTSTGTISITGSLANDILVFNSTSLGVEDVINGGGGTDLLGFVSGGSFSDAAFTGVQSIETLALADGSSATITLDAEALEAGIERVNVYDDGTEIDLTVLAGFMHDLTVDLDAFGASDLAPTNAGSDVIDASAMDVANKLTVAARAGSLAGNSIVAGANTGDELVLTADDQTANLSGLRSLEIVTIKGGAGSASSNTIGIDITDDVVASGEMLTVTAGGASGLTHADAQLFFNGSLELDGKLDVTGGAGADDIAGGAGDDTLRGGANNDILTAGVGTDTLQGDAGDDIFKMGGNLTLADTVNGGAGNADKLITSSTLLADSAFTLVSQVEQLELEQGATVTFGATAQSAGFNMVVGSGGDDVLNVGSAFTAALTFDLSGGGVDTLNAANKAGAAVTVKADASDLGNADVLAANPLTANNTILLRADNGTAVLDNVSGFSTVTVQAGLAADADITIYVGTDSVVAALQTLIVNASALTNAGAALYFDGYGETNGSFVVTGGAGADQLYDGAFDDTLNGGAGNDILGSVGGDDVLNGEAGDDVIYIAEAQLDSDDTIDGGSHTASVTGDVLDVSGTGTIDDTDLTGVTLVETLRRTGTGTTQLGFEAFNGGSGIKRFVGSSGADVLNIAAAYTGAITVDLKTAAGGTDTVDASLSTAAVTIEANAGDITNDTLKGGTSLADVLKLTADNGFAQLGAGDSGFETITVMGNGANDISIEVASDTVLLANTTMIVNAAGLVATDALLWFNGSAVTSTNKAFSVTGGSNGDDITGGEGSDTLIGGAGNDTLVGNGGLDTITGGDGDDTITGGIGNDVINAGNDSDFVYAGLGNDVIDLGNQAGASDIDRVIFEVSSVTGIASVSNFDAAEDIFTVTSGATWSANTEVRQSIGPAANARLIVLDNLQYGVDVSAANAADGLHSGGAVGESYLVVYRDNANLVHVLYSTVDGGGDSGADAFFELATLNGVNIANLNLADFDFA